MKQRIIVNDSRMQFTIDRLCIELIENHHPFLETVIIGIQPRGIYLSDRIMARLKILQRDPLPLYGKLDITFYRDDFRMKNKVITASDTTIDFPIENKKIVLIDDVLYTGRTIRAALDSLIDYGRPSKVELLTLVDRRLSREFPIEPDYVGLTVDAIESELVRIDWEERDGEDRVWILQKQVSTL